MSGSAFFEVREETEFPCEIVSVQKKSTGQMIDISKPIGRFCCKCDSGTSAGMPYFDKEDLHAAVMESPSLKALCRSVTEAYHTHGADAAGSTGESVHSVEDSRDILRVIYDAFERHDFISHHMGATPEELHVDPVQTEHPRTDEPLVLFPSEGEPHFQFICDYALGTCRKQNRMAQSVYAEQGRHTFDYFKSKLQSSLRSTCPPPPRAVMQLKMKELAAKRNPNLRQSIVKAEPRSAAIAMAQSPLGVAAPSMGPSAIFFPPTPPAKREVAGAAAAGVRFTAALVATAAKSAPPAVAARVAKPAAASAAGSAGVKLVVSTKATKDSTAEVKEEDSAKAASPPLKRPGESTMAPPLKQAKLAVKAEPGSTPQPRQLEQRELTPQKPRGSVPWVDLAKVSSPQSPLTQSPVAKGDNKFENCLKPLALARVLHGENVEKDLTVARRLLGFAKRESPDEWAPKIEERLEHIAGCKEIVQSKILARNKLEPVYALIGRVQKAFDGEMLPLFAWCDWVCAFEAFNHLKPYKVTSDPQGLLKALKLHSSTKTVNKYNHESPSWFLEHIPEQERIDGIVADRYVVFMEKVVLPGLIKVGISGREVLEKFLCAIVDMINGGPEAYRQSKVLAPFRERLLGALCTVGRVLYLRGCTSARVQVLMANPSNPFYHALKLAAWSSALLDTAFMSSIGEKVAWPVIEDAVKQLGNSADAQAGFGVLETIIANHPVWVTQCRDGSLSEYLRPKVLEWCEATLHSQRVTNPETHIVSYDSKDPIVIAVLQHLRACKVLKWEEVKLDNLLMELIPVATSLQKLDDQSNVAAVCAIEAGKLTASSDDALQAFATSLQSTLPTTRGTSVLITGECRKQIVETVLAFSEVVVQRWPNDNVYPCVVVLQERFEIEVQTPLEADGFDLKKAVNAFRSNLFAFRRMQGFHNHLEEIRKIGDFNAKLVESDANAKMIMKLALYLEFFNTDEKFVNLTLPSNIDNSLQLRLCEAHGLVSKFKDFYYGNSLQTAEGETEKLRLQAGGAANGESWRSQCKDDLSWDDFCTATESTLRAVRKVELIVQIAAVDKVSRP